MTPDRRLGIVRLPLPDGRALPLQLTFAALDAHGHDWFLSRFKEMQRGHGASATARAELLEAMSAGSVTAEDVRAAPVASYPMASTMKAVWEAWELAQYGPDGREAAPAPENPRKRPPTWWARITGKH